jgi:hypothetical protein
MIRKVLLRVQLLNKFLKWFTLNSIQLIEMTNGFIGILINGKQTIELLIIKN